MFNGNETGFYHNNSLKGINLKQNQFIGLGNKNDFKVIEYPYKHSLSYIKRATFNMSSIALRKDILLGYNKELIGLITSPDSFMALISIISKVSLFIDNNQLTFYRIHENNTSLSKNAKKSISFNENLEIPALFAQLRLAYRSGSKAGTALIKNLLFLS